MVGLSENMAQGLCDAVEAEHRSRAEAQAAVGQFGSVPVLAHLEESADRHLGTLIDVLRGDGLDTPVLAPVTTSHHESLAEALDAAFDRETRTAALYDRLLRDCDRPDLRRVLFNLWQATAHRHRAALAHRLSVEQQPSDG